MHFRYYLSAAALLVLAAYAGAVELGDAHVRSFIGQPLSADIELTGLAGDAPVQAAVADADVYRGASIAMHPALAVANLSTYRRDGKRYLHISSSVPMKSDHIPIFFSLTENGQKSVRQATLWLTADPNPAPPPPPPAPPAPILAPVPAPMPVAAPVIAAVAPASMPAPAPKVVLPKIVPALPFVPLPAAVRHPVSLPRAAAAPACASRPAAAGEGDSCAALDAKNAALNAHLAELEDKVKQLSALQAGAAAPAVSAAPVKIAPPKPLPPKLVPMGSKPPEHDTGRPLLIIGIVAAIILSLAAGLGVMLLRQKKKAKLKRKVTELVAGDAAVPPPALPPKPSFIASVKNRLMPGKGAAPAEAEPVNTVPAL